MRKPAALLLQTSIGAVLGLAAAFVQEQLISYGALAAAQRAMLFACFAAVGGALAALSRLAFRRGGIVVGALVTGAAFAALVPFNARDLPDVYLLVTDTTRADHLSLHGYERETTPFLERFARDAVVFENAVSQGSHTIVSTPSILASVYPSEHGLRDYSDVLPDRLKLVSEYLKENGYRTFGLTTNPHLRPGAGFHQGFDRYESLTNRGWSTAPSAARVNRHFLSWRDEQDEGPLFAFLFYVDAHTPYDSPPAFQKLFDPDWEGEPVKAWDPDTEVPSEPTPAFRNMVAQYDGAIAYWDSELEKLVAALEARGVFDDALVIYTSDHGEEFLEHGSWGHNRTLFEESVHVPLVVSLPAPVRFPPLPRVSGVVNEVVSSVDVLPTLLAYLNIEPGSGVRGSNLLPLVFAGEGSNRGREVYLEEILDRYGPYDVRAIRSRTHKYVRILDYEGDRRPRDLFFDLHADPGEQVNLLAEGRNAADERVRLEARMEQMEDVGPRTRRSAPLTPELKKQLQNLGYLK